MDLAGKIVVSVVLALSLWLAVSVYSRISSLERLIRDERKEAMTPIGGIQITAEIPCGRSTVTLTTVCGTDYEGNPISPPETFQQCHDRHEAKKAEIERVCEGDD